MDDIDLYCNLMQEVKKRTAVLQGFLDGQINAIYPTISIECAALQLRKILELIALGSLVAHREEYAANYNNLANHGHAERILRDIGKINPEFYPKPMRGFPSIHPGTNIDLMDVKDGFLTKNDFISTYSALGDILHAKNPFALQTDYGRSKDRIKEAIGKTVVLLNTHQIQLFNSPNIWLVNMKEDRDERVHVYVGAPKSKELDS